MEYNKENFEALSRQILKLKDLIIEKDFEISNLRDKVDQLQSLAEQYYKLYTDLVNSTENQNTSTEQAKD